MLVKSGGIEYFDALSVKSCSASAIYVFNCGLANVESNQFFSASFFNIKSSFNSIRKICLQCVSVSRRFVCVARVEK